MAPLSAVSISESITCCLFRFDFDFELRFFLLKLWVFFLLLGFFFLWLDSEMIVGWYEETVEAVEIEADEATLSIAAERLPCLSASLAG